MRISIDMCGYIREGGSHPEGLESLASSLMEHLGSHYENLAVRASFSGCFGMYWLDGYCIGEHTAKEVGKGPFLGIGRSLTGRGMRELVYVGYDQGQPHQQLLHVRTDEQPVIDACNNIAERAGVSVQYRF